MAANKTSETRRKQRAKARIAAASKKQKPVERANLREYDPKYLNCRDLRHAWERKGFFRTPDGTIRQVLQCLRCKAIGNDEFTRSGVRTRPRRYQYRDGYRIGKLDPVTVRNEVVKRSHVFRSEQQMMDEVFNGKNGKH